MLLCSVCGPAWADGWLSGLGRPEQLKYLKYFKYWGRGGGGDPPHLCARRLRTMQIDCCERLGWTVWLSQLDRLHWF